MAHNRAQPLPDNVTDLADLTMCSFCGETYDESWADLAFFHNSGHAVTDAPHVRGVRAKHVLVAPPPIPGA